MSMTVSCFSIFSSYSLGWRATCTTDSKDSQHFCSKSEWGVWSCTTFAEATTFRWPHNMFCFGALIYTKAQVLCISALLFTLFRLFIKTGLNYAFLDFFHCQICSFKRRHWSSSGGRTRAGKSLLHAICYNNCTIFFVVDTDYSIYTNITTQGLYIVCVLVYPNSNSYAFSGIIIVT